MDPDPLTGRPRPYGPIETPKIGDDPDGGQVINPDGSSPEDPAARGMFQGCLIMMLVIGIFVGVFVLLYRMFVAPELEEADGIGKHAVDPSYIVATIRSSVTRTT